VCGVQKFVCTTIQPTELPFGELYDWYGAADFVADYLNFIPLEPPHELVRFAGCLTTSYDHRCKICSPSVYNITPTRTELQ